MDPPSIVYEQWLWIDHANMSKAGPINRDTHLDYPRKDDLNLRETNVSWMPEWLHRILPSMMDSHSPDSALVMIQDWVWCMRQQVLKVVWYSMPTAE